MTESSSPAFVSSQMVISPVTPADPPFRLVQIHGETAGVAHDIVDVFRLAHAAGLTHVDLDDPAVVRWIGGGKYKWMP